LLSSASALSQYTSQPGNLSGADACTELANTAVALARDLVARGMHKEASETYKLALTQLFLHADGDSPEIEQLRTEIQARLLEVLSAAAGVATTTAGTNSGGTEPPQSVVPDTVAQPERKGGS